MVGFLHCSSKSSNISFVNSLISFILYTNITGVRVPNIAIVTVKIIGDYKRFGTKIIYFRKMKVTAYELHLKGTHDGRRNTF